MRARSAAPFSRQNTRGPRRARAAALAALLAAAALPAYAASSVQPCPTDNPTLVCRLRSVLTILDTAAIILAVLLILVLAAVVRAYRRKAKNISPDDITPDAP